MDAAGWRARAAVSRDRRWAPGLAWWGWWAAVGPREGIQVGERRSCGGPGADPPTLGAVPRAGAWPPGGASAGTGRAGPGHPGGCWHFAGSHAAGKQALGRWAAPGPGALRWEPGPADRSRSGKHHPVRQGRAGWHPVGPQRCGAEMWPCARGPRAGCMGTPGRHCGELQKPGSRGGTQEARDG